MVGCFAYGMLLRAVSILPPLLSVFSPLALQKSILNQTGAETRSIHGIETLGKKVSISEVLPQFCSIPRSSSGFGGPPQATHSL
ncbi:hypothetical protein BJX96DRAFT_147187 [Aspergillus floccosus]